jgi:acetyl esterase
VSLKARDEAGPGLVHQLLIYPVTDTNFETESYIANQEGYMLTLDGMRWFWDHYLSGNANGASNPLAVPMRAPDLSRLPSATVITAEYDPLRDEGEAYGQRLIDAGVSTTVQRYDGMIHGFFGMAEMLEGSRQAMRLAADQLKAAFKAA